MKTVNINLPEDIYNLMSNASSSNKNFFAEAILEKIARENQKVQNVLLAEGYKTTFDEDLNITKEFEDSDFESHE